MQKIVILDYANARVIVRDVETANEEVARDVVQKEGGINFSDCDWMGGYLRIDIQ